MRMELVASGTSLGHGSSNHKTSNVSDHANSDSHKSADDSESDNELDLDVWDDWFSS